MMTNVMVKTCLNQKIIKNSNLIQAIKNSVCPTANVTRRPIFSESRIFRRLRIVDSTNDMIIVKWHLLNFSKARICPNIYRMFRSVNWTHDMIIVKWHLFIWHERKLCARTNAPPVQSTQRVNDYQRYSMLTVLPLRSMSCTLGSSSSLQASVRTILVGITIHWARRRILWKIFLYLMMTNVMVKTCPNQKIIKNSNLIQAIKNSVCPTANVTRRPIFSESRIFRSFRVVDSTSDMIVVKWHLWSFSKAEFVRIFTECSEVWIEHTTW